MLLDLTTTSSLGLFLPSLSSPDLRPTTASTTLSDDDWSNFFTMPSTPPAFNTPDDIFTNNWGTPLDLTSHAPALMMSHGSSSPTDFAFEAPSDNKTPLSGYSFTPSTGNSYGLPYSGYSSASSFSSASGSYGGASFSSADALPAISRDFSRPSLQQAKRPATAGGLLQSRSPFGGFIARETIDETGVFSNPFGSTIKPAPVEIVDPHFIPSSRRASEGQGTMPPPSWPQNNDQLASAPATTFSYQQMPTSANTQRQNYAARPQTSDGLPSFGGPTPLPSARSVVGSFSGFNSSAIGLQPPVQIRSSYDEGNSRDRSDSRVPYIPGAARSDGGDLTFVAIGGPQPRKRPRRRFDEIERLYKCGWSGCEKSYGTLNHLNAHVSMQKHGEKRLPAEFRDMRKAWRKKKREAVAASANGAQYTGSSWGRSSMSSESDVDRRESTSSVMSSTSGHYPAATSSGYTYDSRPNTSSSVASTSDGRYYSQQTNVPPFGYGQPIPPSSTMPFSASSSLQARRESAPQHMAMPTHPMGFRQNDDGITPTAQNPYPSTMSMYHTQPPAHQYPATVRPGTGGFPFQTLTAPVPQSVTSQFAFQRGQ